MKYVKKFPTTYRYDILIYSIEDGLALRAHKHINMRCHAISTSDQQKHNQTHEYCQERRPATLYSYNKYVCHELNPQSEPP